MRLKCSAFAIPPSPACSMTELPAAIAALCHAVVRRETERVLATPCIDGAPRPLTLLDLYVPPLVAYTQEDKEAKGLRKLDAGAIAPRPPVHYTARDMADAEPYLLLTGGSGMGKSTFVRALALHLSAPYRQRHALRSRCAAAWRAPQRSRRCSARSLEPRSRGAADGHRAQGRRSCSAVG